jgi:hypothetical protein
MTKLYDAGLGAIAGAAGTLALDAITYGDIVLRGRPPSTMPAEMIRRLAEKAGIAPFGKPDDDVDETVRNRRNGLAALSGYVIGLSVGAAYGVLRPLTSKMPLMLQLVTLTTLMMIASDGPAAIVGATDPKTWGPSGWISDLVPHVGYALVATCVFRLYEGNDGAEGITGENRTGNS